MSISLKKRLQQQLVVLLRKIPNEGLKPFFRLAVQQSRSPNRPNSCDPKLRE